MKLPERMYYPLPEAAQKLGCTVKDLYHFAAIGVLNVVVFLPSLKHEQLLVIIPPEMEDDIDREFGGALGNERWTISGIMMQKDAQPSGYYAGSMSGFFYLNQICFATSEFLGDAGKIHTPHFTTRPESEGCECEVITFDGAIEIDPRFLCVMADDLTHIKTTGVLPVKESPKTAAKKAELIPALIKLIPELGDLDLEAISVSKVIAVLEATAAARGVEFPSMDKNTWAKYLGRK
jgi:hypothetical protein